MLWSNNDYDDYEFHCLLKKNDHGKTDKQQRLFICDITTQPNLHRTSVDPVARLAAWAQMTTVKSPKIETTRGAFVYRHMRFLWENKGNVDVGLYFSKPSAYREILVWCCGWCHNTHISGRSNRWIPPGIHHFCEASTIPSLNFQCVFMRKSCHMALKIYFIWPEPNYRVGHVSVISVDVHKASKTEA